MTYRCPNCDHRGAAKRYTRGSVLTEILLWLFFLVPGLIYSIWRLASRYRGCAACGWAHIVRVEAVADATT